MGPGASLAKCPLPSSEIKSSPPLPSHTHHSKLEAVLLESPWRRGGTWRGSPKPSYLISPCHNLAVSLSSPKRLYFY